MSNTTRKGEGIAYQIQGENAYGYNGELTLADVWLIVDNIHTHFMDTNRDTEMFERWIQELEEVDPELPA